MDQLRLWTPPLDALSISAHHQIGSGWHCSVQLRRHGEPWGLLSSTYEALHAGELVDVVCAELEHAWTPPGPSWVSVGDGGAASQVADPPRAT